MNIKEALEFGRSSLDTEVLLCHILKKDKTWLYSHQDDILTSDRRQKYHSLIARRKKGVPVAYLTHHQEFFGLDFYVDENVLIPRPETELIVELALDRIKNHESRIKNIIDIGTGSSNIIIVLAKTLPSRHSEFISESLKIPKSVEARSRSAGQVRDNIQFYATDISVNALKVARKNAHKHQVKVNFIKSDLFKSIPKSLKFDLIVANLPYLWKDYPLFEPRLALDGGRGGLQVIKRFLIETKPYLKKKSVIIFEIDPRQTKAIKKIIKNIYPEKLITLKKDLAGLDRAVILS